MGAETVRKRNRAFLVITTVFSLAILGLGVVAGDPRTRLFYVVTGAALAVTALLGFGRVSTAATDVRLGAVSIQHNWITLSVSLAFLALVPATFFETAVALRAAAGTLAGLLVVASAFLLLDIRRETGIDLSI